MSMGTVLIIMLIALFGALVFVVFDERARLERQWKTKDKVSRERYTGTE